MPTTSDGIKIPTDNSTLRHIFRNADNHLNPSTLSSQQRVLKLFYKVASDPNNLNNRILTQHAIQAGVKGFLKIFKNGEVWVHCRPDGTIFNAGVNIIH